MMRGFIIAAPHSGAGKTMITLGILRALQRQSVEVVSAKSGPDYIDPTFHRAASGAPCVNLDAWAMPPAQLRALATAKTGDMLVIEGAMGLFDGAPDISNPMGRGSVADLAEILDLPIILVLDAARQSQTAAAIVHGLASLRPGIKIAGVILNQIGSPRHGNMILKAINALGIPVLGAIPRMPEMQMPSRHLGLIQALEHPNLERFIENAAGLIARHIDLDVLQNLAAEIPTTNHAPALPPLGQNIAIAQDAAFAFSYPHLLSGWRRAGAQFSFFSPLKNEGPDTRTDAVFLPGGYPELHAEKLAHAANFAKAMHMANARNALIYGECGGYMTLGETLCDNKGITHRMLGLLPVHTSFENPRLHLGYRHLQTLGGLPWENALKGHEFHYATIVHETPDGRLFKAKDSLQTNLPDIGHIRKNTCGSFAHVIG